MKRAETAGDETRKDETCTHRTATPSAFYLARSVNPLPFRTCPPSQDMAVKRLYVLQYMAATHHAPIRVRKCKELLDERASI